MAHAPKHLYRRFLPFLKPYWKTGVLIACFNVIMLAFGFAVPLLMQYLIDEVILNKDVSQFVLVIILFFVANQLPSVVLFFKMRIHYVLQEHVFRDIRLRLFEKIERLPVLYLQEHQPSELTAKLTNDVDQCDPLMYDDLIGNVLELVRFTVAAIILFSMNWVMAALAVMLVPLYVVIVKKLKDPIDERYADVLKRYEKNIADYQNTLENLYLVKAFVLESLERDRLKRTIDWFIYSVKRFLNVYLFSKQASDFLRNLSLVIVFGYGGYLVIQGQLTLGTLIAFNTIAGMLFSSVTSISSWLLDIQKSKAALTRIFEILDQKEESYRPHGESKLPRIRGKITFENVHFAYDKKKGKILEGFNLEVKAGERVAIVGPSGSGKSSIAKLLMHFYETDEGQIRIDDIPVESFDVQVLRNQIGEVQQSNFIMRGTIYENILFGQDDVPIERVIECARKAYAHDFIDRLPKKYFEEIHQHYANLSGGQLQRIAITRALLKDPPILILDEATSALDPESEQLILKSLDDLMKDRTTIMISHHLQTLKKMDRIVVLDHKHIVEEGSFDELMAKKGRFYQILFETTEAAKPKPKKAPVEIPKELPRIAPEFHG